MAKFYVPESLRPSLEAIAAMSEAEVEEIRQALGTASPSLKMQNLVGHVQSKLAKDITGLEAIIQTLSSMNNARLGADVSVDEFVEDVALTFTERKVKQFGAEDFKRKLGSLLSLPSLIQSARAFDVQHEYDKLLVAARIMSDVRTVFNQAGTEAVGAMIVHNLVIKYSQSGDFKELFVALDDADIAKLRRVLERAEAKTAILEKLIDKAGVPYLDSK